jgi:type II secretory pathway component GspD/PulD (secretin)
MQLSRALSQRSNSVPMFTFAILILALPFSTAAALAQDTPAESKPPQTYQTFYLTHVTESNDASEIVSDLRNMLPHAHVMYLRSEDAISILGAPDELKLAHNILSDVDRTRKTWRLTYTITQTGTAQATSPQHVSLIVAAGQRADLKQGSRVPIVTGATAPDASSTSTQVQYLDVGLNISADVNGSADSIQLHTKIEQSQVADEKSGSSPQDPVIHQTTLDVTSNLTPGKPTVLGTLDIPGDTRHEQIEVTAEPIP